MIALSIFFIVSLMILMILRIIWINNIVEEWNKSLKEYILTMDEKPGVDRLYFERYYLEERKLYFRVAVWRIEHIIDDVFLLDDISKMNYRNMVRNLMK